jgi:hypothetical protein
MFQAFLTIAFYDALLIVMRSESASEKELIALTKEVCVMTSMQKHENVIQLLGCCWTADGK